jgi:hypothetical protein
MTPTARLLAIPVALIAGCAFLDSLPGEPAEGGDDELIYAELESGRPLDVIRAESFGIAEITADGDAAFPVVHVRLTVVNRFDELPWRVDALNASLGRVGRRGAPPLFINTDIPTLPIVRIEGGEQRDIDFYFPVPDGIDAGAGPGSLELRVRVDTPERNMAWYARVGPTERSTQLETRPAGAYTRWWSNPTYPWPAFNRRPGRKTHRVPRTIEVTRTPRWNDGQLASGPRAIRNESSRELRELRLSPIVEHAWEPSLIAPLVAGAETAVSAIACTRYDVLVVDEREARCVLPLVHLCFGAETWAIDDVTLEHCRWQR